MTTQKDTVKMIDDKERFDAIPTGYKSISGIKNLPSDVVLNHYKTMFKKFKDQFKLKNMTNILWVAKHRDTIKNHYETHDKYQNSTKRIYMEALARTLLSIDKVKHKAFVRAIYVTTIQWQKDKDKEQEDQAMTKSETKNYICFSELAEVRDKLHEKWQSKKKDLNLHNQWLILALNTYLPPIRMDYVDMEFFKGKKEPPKNGTNYMWQNGEKFSVVMNSDKIEGKRTKKGLEREIFDMPTNSYMNGDKMMELLKESLDAFPRKYVLVSVQRPKEAMSRNSYYSHIKVALKETGKVPRQNLLRKIYINEMHHFHEPTLSLAQKKDIARRMRHTYETAQLNYEKLEIEQLCKPKKKHKKKKDTEPEPEPEPVQPQNGQFDLKQWSKTYYEANKEAIKKKRAERFDDKKYDILRAKIIRNLNNGTVAKPMKATKEKYSLVFEEGEWK